MRIGSRHGCRPAAGIRWYLVLVFCLVLAVLPVASTAKEEGGPELTLVAHAVLKTVSQSGVNLIELFKTATGVQNVEWRTFALGEIIDTLYRESSLPDTEIDVGFIVERAMSARVTTLFEPLDAYLERDPLPNFEDFFPGMIDTLTIGGKLYGIPIRSVVNVLHYNKAIFAERGIDKVPQTFEEFIELARELTFTRANGEKVSGFSMQGTESEIYGTVLALARAWGGDFITPEYEVIIDQEPVVHAVTLLRDWWAEQVLPGNFNTMTVNDNYDVYKSNRAAMTIAPAPSYAIFNDPQQSSAAGNSEIMPLPPAAALVGELTMAAPTTSFWLMVIPQTARNKDLSWLFIKYLSSPEAQVQMTFNGNGPTRASVYADTRVVAELGYAAVAKDASVYALPIWPPFDAQAEAQDILGREVHNAIFGGKDPAQAMRDAAAGIRPLVADLAAQH